MTKSFLLTFLTISILFQTVPDSQARRRLSRRQKMHHRWISGVTTNYLDATDYNSCWTNSQQPVTPSTKIYNFKYRRCLKARRFYRRLSRRRKSRIRRRCKAKASTLVFPTHFQQKQRYVRCLRHRRYNKLRNYLLTVTCGHLRHRPYRRCQRRLYRNIALYGYKNPAHLRYLDNVYRTRYVSFRTRHPRHRFVKKYHKRHHFRKRAHRRKLARRRARKRKNKIIKRHRQRNRRREAKRRERQRKKRREVKRRQRQRKKRREVKRRQRQRKKRREVKRRQRQRKKRKEAKRNRNKNRNKNKNRRKRRRH